MKIQREGFYFEPRVVDGIGNIKWYGDSYFNAALRRYNEETVYIRDNGSELFVYKLSRDEMENENKINAVFRLICKIQKNNDLWIYGRKNKD